jgi:hypothetical protein
MGIGQPYAIVDYIRQSRIKTFATGPLCEPQSIRTSETTVNTTVPLLMQFNSEEFSLQS